MSKRFGISSGLAALALASSALFSAPASAEVVFSAYGGYQSAPHSRVTGNDPSPGGVGAFSFGQGWQGNSFKPPLYWGVRATWWLESKPNLGFSLDYTHAKVYAAPLPPGWQTLEFTDGLNLLTVNALYRFHKEGRRWTPYVGAGVGVSVPHVEVQTSPTAARTFEYQLGGVALQAQLGLDFKVTERFSVFTEYKFNYTMNRVRLNGGGNLKTNIITNAVNVGLSYHWK